MPRKADQGRIKDRCIKLTYFPETLLEKHWKKGYSIILDIGISFHAEFQMWSNVLPADVPKSFGSLGSLSVKEHDSVLKAAVPHV